MKSFNLIKDELINIDLKIDKGDITIETIDTDDNQLEIDFTSLRQNAIEENLIVSFENNTLTIQDNKSEIHKKMTKVATDLVIRIPSTDYIVDNLSISSCSGDIEIVSLEKCNSAKFALTSNDINISDATFDNLFLNTTSGDISLNDLVINQDLKVNCVSGDIDFNDTKINGNTNVNTVSGDTSINDSIFSGTFTVNSVSGDAHINDSTLSLIFVKTMNGDFAGKNISFINDSENNSKNSSLANSSIVTFNGDIDLHIEKYELKSCLNINTNMGDVDVSGNIPDQLININKHNMGKNKSNKSHNIAKEITHKVINRVMNKIAAKKENSESGATTETTNDKDQNIEKILQMLKENKINVQQAEELISAIK